MSDFKSKLVDMRTLVQRFGKKYGFSDTYLGIDTDTAQLIKYVELMVK